MKVYLINPPGSGKIAMVREGRCMQRKGAWTTVWPPVTLATIAAMLLEEGFQVNLSDCSVDGTNWKKLAKNIFEFRPDIILVNTATASIVSDLSTVAMAKEIDININTVAIGIHVTALPQEAFQIQPQLDFVIRGEPEFCFQELCLALRDNLDPGSIRGLSFKRDGQLYHNPEREFVDDLNRLPFPAWELIDPRDYPLPLSGEPFLLVTTGKGCPYRCIFCPAKPYYGKTLRLRDVNKVVDEMEHVKKKIGVREFLIWAESFADNDDYVFSFCEEILKRDLGVSWTCNARVDRVSLDKLKKMRQAGCWMIGYGIESGVQEILDEAGKGTNLEQIRQAVAWARQAKIGVTAHIIFGLPGETPQTARRTIKFIKGLDIDFLQCYCAVPWPSTALYKLAKQRGWLKSLDWSLYEQNHSVIELPTISSRQVEEFRRRAFLEFYLLPRIIFRTLRRIKSFRAFRNFLSMIREFVRWI
jgi:radical SAM superfamily enzyme YgiQ (UPF0313 family)